jgi:hypothetical protein
MRLTATAVFGALALLQVSRQTRETFGNSRPKKFEHRFPETIGDKKSPRLAGLSRPKKEIL